MYISESGVEEFSGNRGTSGTSPPGSTTSATWGCLPFCKDLRVLRLPECPERVENSLRTEERADLRDCAVAGLGSVGDSSLALPVCPSIMAREFCCSWVVKSLRAARRLRAERVGAGGGSFSKGSGLGSEIVCIVRLDTRRMETADAAEGAGVGNRANLLVSL